MSVCCAAVDLLLLPAVCHRPLDRTPAVIRLTEGGEEVAADGERGDQCTHTLPVPAQRERYSAERVCAAAAASPRSRLCLDNDDGRRRQSTLFLYSLFSLSFLLSGMSSLLLLVVQADDEPRMQ